MTHKNTVQLHSRYNPRLEAERYIKALTIPDGISYFILIEPALGYLVPVLKEFFPGTKIIALHADISFSASPAASLNYDGIPSWFPDGKISLQHFLESEIPDVSGRAVRIIEWRPSLRLYGEAYRFLLAETAAFIRRADANMRTSAHFGRRWLKNFFRNINLPRTFVLPAPSEIPVIIAGSGPSLEDTLPLIRSWKDEGTVFVLAASSAFTALVSAGITPDLVISTDGGSWALLHLNECFRRQSKDSLCTSASPGSTAIAVNFCASLPSQATSVPFLVMNDGSLWQNIILNSLHIPSVPLPQRGTVTASALDLALLLSRGNIFITGMDLGLNDIRTHARPYGFDHLFRDTADRLDPLYSQDFFRAEGIKNGGSHRIYAAWFAEQLESWPDRIFSLGNNNPLFDSRKENKISETVIRSPKNANQKIFANPLIFAPVPNHDDYSKDATEILAEALADSTLQESLTEELSSLLFPGEKRKAHDVQAEIQMLLKSGGNYG